MAPVTGPVPHGIRLQKRTLLPCGWVTYKFSAWILADKEIQLSISLLNFSWQESLFLSVLCWPTPLCLSCAHPHQVVYAMAGGKGDPCPPVRHSSTFGQGSLK